MVTVKYIPQYMKSFNNWVLWKKVPLKDGRTSKIPYSANYRGKASSTNSKSWCSYEKAIHVLHNHSSEYDGIGFVFSANTNLVFIDLDHCFTDEGKILKSASDIVNRFLDTYIEVSQSGAGLHIIACGTIEKAIKTTAIEMYKDKRFVAFTGNALNPKDCVDCSQEISKLYEEYAPKNIKTTKPIVTHENNITVTELIELACRNKKNGLLFKELYNGNWESYYDSQSQADQSFCNMLAFWCNRDIDLMNSIFCSCGLYRDKWNREDYRTKTLNNAVTSCTMDFEEFKNNGKGNRLWKIQKRADYRKRMSERLQNPQI